MTRPIGSREALMEALYDVVAHAIEYDRNKLSGCLEEYAYRYPASYRNMAKGNTLLASLLDVLEESSDARIFKDANGKPYREE